MTGISFAGGRVLDPARGIDEVMDVAVSDGVVSAPGEVPPGSETVDARGLILTPGFVDLHTHLYQGVSHYGVDADTYCLRRGVTTAVDAGSSGAQTFPGLLRFIVDPAETRILAFLHVAVQGMITNLLGELEDLRWASPDQAIARAREHPEVIVGVKVRLGYQMVGNDPEPALKLARQAADELGLPLMVHVIDMKRPITWLLGHLVAGDIVTHCFHGNEGGILEPDGRLFPEVVAHVSAACSSTWGTASAASPTGSHVLRSPRASHPTASRATSTPTTSRVPPMTRRPRSQSSCTWDDPGEVIRATTAPPASAIRQGGALGSLAPGREADLTVFELRTGNWRLTDGEGATETAEQLLVPR